MHVRPRVIPGVHEFDELVPLLSRRDDGDFVAELEKSLQMAKQAAGTDQGLDPGLFAALDWPTTFDEYVDFLLGFVTLIPQQSSDDVSLQPDTPEHREVYDRLCHFYFLIDQPVGPGGTTLQDIEWFKKCRFRLSCGPS